MHRRAWHWIGVILLAACCHADEPASAFRVRPYLQNPAPDAMTVRWLTNDDAPGTLRVAGREFTSAPVLCLELAYQPNEARDDRLGSAPFLHSVRVTGLEPATSYPYAVEQGDESRKAILTTAPKPGDVGPGGCFSMPTAKHSPSRAARASSGRRRRRCQEGRGHPGWRAAIPPTRRRATG
jgi:hypothetical protein